MHSSPDKPISHEIRVDARGRFLLPACTCGWIGTARLTTASAREEARDHALLYASGDVSAIVEFDPAVHDQAE